MIQGRGITDPEQYYRLERIGRRTNLRRSQREAVWRLHTEHAQLKRDAGIVDWDDVLLLARDELRTIPEPTTARSSSTWSRT